MCLSRHRLLGLACLLLLLGSSPGMGRSIDVHVAGGPGTGERVLLRVVDLAGLVVLVRTIEVCQSYQFQIDSELPLYVQVYGNYPWRVLYLGWHRAPGNVTFAPVLPTGAGFCGDGQVNAAEGCDTRGNVGCDPQSSRPACVHCVFCGCAADTDCPAPEPAVGPCGFGRFTAEQRPHFAQVCVYNMCMLTYSCGGDPACAARSCGSEATTQQACATGCTGADERCYYEQPIGCWSCLEPGEVGDPCANPSQSDCMLDPAMMGMACENGSEDEYEVLLEQFALDGLSEDEGELLPGVRWLRRHPTYVRFAKDGNGLPWLSWPPDLETSAWWNVYRGSLNVCEATGIYTQIPGSNPFAGRLCQVAVAEVADPQAFPTGDMAFYLVTRVDPWGEESGLGLRSDQTERPLTIPCP